MHTANMEDEYGRAYEHNYMKDVSNKAPRIKVCTNNNRYDPAKTITVHKSRNFDSFLSTLTEKMKPPFGAIRNIYTPNHGSRVTSFDQLQEGGYYVIADHHRLRKYEYQNIADIQRSKQKNQRREHQDAHFASSRYKDVQAKAVQQGKEKFGKIIYVYENGNDVDPFNVCCVKQKLLQACNDEQERWRIFLDQISAKAKFKVEKLYRTDGIQITDADAVMPNDNLVACPSKKDRFISKRYENGKQNLKMTTPRETFGTPPTPTFSRHSLNRSYPVVPPIKKGGPKTHMSSPDSYPQSQYGRAKRSYENTPNNRPRRAKPRQVDYDQDQSGVYRAKNKGREAAGAQQDENIRDGRSPDNVDDGQRVHTPKTDQNPPDQVDDGQDHIDTQDEGNQEAQTTET